MGCIDPSAPNTEWLHEHMAGLRQHLARRMPSHADAEDIAQEACLKLLSVSNLRHVRQPKAYLYRIAHNLVSQHYRAQLVDIETGFDVDGLPAADPSSDELAGSEQQRRLIGRAMRELSPKCQTALALRWWRGLRVAEIADHMTLSRAMVKKYLAHGKTHFRKRLRRVALAD